VDSIRQVDVDLNYLLVLYSTVGLYRLVCLSVGENRTRPPKIKHELDGDTYGCQLENTTERSENSSCKDPCIRLGTVVPPGEYN